MARGARLFAIASAVNFLWEMAQMRLYVGAGPWLQQTTACATASLGDGGMVLAIFATGALVCRRLTWYRRPEWLGYVVMVTSGALLAAAFEMSALRGGRWVYSSSMPRLPFLASLGLLPILQMIVLPPIVFRIAAIVER